MHIMGIIPALSEDILVIVICVRKSHLREAYIMLEYCKKINIKTIDKWFDN